MPEHAYPVSASKFFYSAFNSLRGRRESDPLQLSENSVEKQWWAREDSNLQPDRYERPALTIELRALCPDGRVGRCFPYNAPAPTTIAPLSPC
jgi:hypothetical protein